jgi:hypothetical protein
VSLLAWNWSRDLWLQFLACAWNFAEVAHANASFFHRRRIQRAAHFQSANLKRLWKGRTTSRNGIL